MNTSEDDLCLEDFITKAGASGGGERANYQLFIIGLCEALALPRPDYSGAETAFNDYVFERNVAFRHPDGSTTSGFIDCYRKHSFVLEAKQSSKRKAVDDDQLSLPAEGFQRRGHAVQGTRRWDRVMVEARRQAENYARALPVDHGYPPFLIVVDVGHVIEVFADFSGQGKNYAHFPDRLGFRITLDDLRDPAVRERLRAIWLDPLSLDPTRRAAVVTRDIADRLARIARRLEKRHDPKDVAAFLMRCVFTMFAEDAELIPKDGFRTLLERKRADPATFVVALESLWRVMDEGGYAPHFDAVVRRFNGALFKDRTALALDADEIGELCVAAGRDWRDVEPSIFGTLLEQALDARERSKLGAHYTPRAYVERLVIPTVIEPLRDDWSVVQTLVRDLLAEGRDLDALNAARRFHRRLCTTRVLDPACGTGNFLYVALELMKRLEGEVLETIRDLGGEPDSYRDFPDEAGRDLVGQKLARTGGKFTVDPHQFHGLELNPRAVPIADLVLWIGFLKWQLLTGSQVAEPVLDAYGTIRQQDAILAHDGEAPALDDAGRPRTRWDGYTRKLHPITGEPVPDETALVPVTVFRKPRRAAWPAAEFIVGNPPFIGGKDMRAELGDGYAEAAWAARPEVPGGADFVMHFWDEAARRLTAKGSPVRRFGFITTNSITQTFSRRVIERRPKGEAPLSLVFAVPDHPWQKAADKAAVRIAMTVAQAGAREGVLATVTAESGLNTDTPQVTLTRREGTIRANLTIGADLAAARPLWANEALSSPGVKLHGAGFIVTPQKAAALGLGRAPGLEKHILPYRNGRDIAQRPRGVMVIDLYPLGAEEVRDRFPAVYQHVIETVRDERDAKTGGTKDQDEYAAKWWLFGKVRQEMRLALAGLPRFISTFETGKHRFFQFLDAGIRPDNMLVNVGLDDPAALAALSARVHVVWAIAAGGWMGVGNDPRYNKTRTFDPFPFPPFSDLPAALRAHLGDLGERLDTFRKERIAAHPQLTMTGLYNALERRRELANGCPVEPLTPAERDIDEAGCVAILAELHDAIDRAVLDAYGWSDLAPALVGKPGGTAPSPHKTPAQEAAEEDLLFRLVALNRARAAEERRGHIRWLRPEFQIPRLAAKAPKPDLNLPDAAPKIAPAAAAAAWPAKDGLDQILAIRAALARAEAPVAPSEIAASFGARRSPAREARVAAVLARMAESGLIQRAGSPGAARYFLPG